MDITDQKITAETRALILHPWLKSLKRAVPGVGKSIPRSPEDNLQETEQLALAIDLKCADRLLVPLGKLHPATLLGTGKVDEIKSVIEQSGANLVIVGCQLTPIQQRNLERAWDTKVIDRTSLILEIFGERARTKEGVLQVELAHLEYQKGRLVRTWTHLERQRGGVGFLGGPGERQIEADRRLIQNRIRKIKEELKKIIKTRALHRMARDQVPYPVVALVGYTNAGKSTLFNRLSGASVPAKDALFETLDPTMRALVLPSGRKIILSDTVGFISQLPPELIAAFRATLEEVRAANIILHVLDISIPDADARKADVNHVLSQLEAGEDHKIVLVCANKADLLAQDELERLQNQNKRTASRIAISALKGQGIDALVAELERLVAKDEIMATIVLKPDRGEALAWLYENSCVLKKQNGKDRLSVQVQIRDKPLGQFQKRFKEDLLELHV